MTITLTNEIEELLNEQVKSGAYRSAEEVILLSLRLFKEQQQKLAELRRAMQDAREDIEQGRYTVCHTDEEMETYTDELIRQAQERRNQVGG